MHDDVIRYEYEELKKDYTVEVRTNVKTNKLLKKIRELVDQPYPDEVDDAFLRHNIRALLEKAGK